MLPFGVFIFPTDRVFGPNTITQEVYEVAARPVVKAAMEGVNGMHNLLTLELYEAPCTTSSQLTYILRPWLADQLTDYMLECFAN